MTIPFSTFPPPWLPTDPLQITPIPHSIYLKTVCSFSSKEVFPAVIKTWLLLVFALAVTIETV